MTRIDQYKSLAQLAYELGSRPRSQPETKVVLGRVLKLDRKRSNEHWDVYSAWVKHGFLSVHSERHEGTLEDPRRHNAHLCHEDGLSSGHIAIGRGPTEADAILALQSQLRKMAELEVE